MDTRRYGLRLLRTALGAVAVFVVAAAGWTAWKALQHPDVRTRRPGWLDPAVGFDVAFWAPLLITIVGGAALVFGVFWRAYRRLRAGEDLYAHRHGGAPEGGGPTSHGGG